MKLPPTPRQSSVHAAPSGHTRWRIELCHFADCFPGSVFLNVSAVLEEHCKSFKGPPPPLRQPMQDAPVCWWEALPLAAEIKTTVSLWLVVTMVVTHASRFQFAQRLLIVDEEAFVVSAFLFSSVAPGERLIFFYVPYLFNSMVLLQSCLLMLYLTCCCAYHHISALLSRAYMVTSHCKVSSVLLQEIQFKNPSLKVAADDLVCPSNPL